MTDKQIIERLKADLDFERSKRKTLQEQLKAKEQECKELRGVIRKDICSHYVLGECSQKHHNNCVGRNQCIKDLEQECEMFERALKEKTDEYNKLIVNYDACVSMANKQLDQLKAENKRLKQAFAESDNDCFRLEKENRLLKIYRSITPLKVKMLVKTLDEIKEIAKLHAPRCNDSADCDFDCDACHLGDLKQILQKISEVVDEN